MSNRKNRIDNILSIRARDNRCGTEEMMERDLDSFYNLLDEAKEAVKTKFSSEELQFLLDLAKNQRLMIGIHTAQALADDLEDTITTDGLATKYPHINCAGLVNQIAGLSHLETM